MRPAAALKYRLSVVSPLERRLREWGLVYGVRPVSENREPDAETALHRASVDRSREAQTAHRAPTSYTRTTVQLDRIRAMLGTKVPAWAAAETVRCTETRTPGGGWCPPKDAEQVESLVLALARWDRRAALALRASYCLLGRRPLSERIAWMASKGEDQVSRMGYRAAIARGRLEVGGGLKLDG